MLESEGAGHRVAYFVPVSLGEGDSFPQASSRYSVRACPPGISALLREELERCWVEAWAGVGEGPGLTSVMPLSKDKLKGGGQKDSTEEATVACSVVARAFD